MASETAVKRRSALRSMLEAAELSQLRGDLQDAERRYRELLAFVGEEGGLPEEVILVLLRLGDVHAAAGRTERALSCWADAEERSCDAGFTSGILECLQRSASAHLTAGTWRSAADAALRGRDLARANGERSLETVFLGIMGQVERRRGNFDAALGFAMDGLQLAQQLGNLEEELTFLADLSLVSLARQDFDGALRQAEIGLRRAREAERPNRATVFLGQKCHALRGLGDLDGARGAAEEGLAWAREHGDDREAATFLHDLALLARERGDQEAALESSLSSYRLFLERGNREGALTSLRCLAQLLAERGDWEAAFKAILDALVLATTMDRELFLVTFFTVAAVATSLWGRGDVDGLSAGLDLVDEFFDGLAERLEADPADSTSMLANLRAAVASLRAAVASGGDAARPEYEEARRLAGGVDSAFGTTFGEYVDGLLRTARGSGD